jgi:hypothetical protein
VLALGPRSSPIRSSRCIGNVSHGDDPCQSDRVEELVMRPPRLTMSPPTEHARSSRITRWCCWYQPSAILGRPIGLFRLCRDMRPPRLSLLELMIVVAILGLACSVPSQYQRDYDRAACRFLARYQADHAAVLAIMADHPAAWMDEFRPGLRQRAAWAMGDSRHFLRSSIYDADEVERVSRANAIARKDQQFWARFATAAAKHGYKKPRINRGGQVRYYWG